MVFQVHGHQRVFRSTAVDVFSGARSSTNFQVHGLLYRGYEHMALTVGPVAAVLHVTESPSSVEHCIAGVADVLAILPIFSGAIDV